MFAQLSSLNEAYSTLCICAAKWLFQNFCQANVIFFSTNLFQLSVAVHSPADCFTDTTQSIVIYQFLFLSLVYNAVETIAKEKKSLHRSCNKASHSVLRQEEKLAVLSSKYVMAL